MLSMFGSTYICESTFSVMKRLKSNARNRLADETLDARLRLATTEVDVDIERLIKDRCVNNKHQMTLNCLAVV